jgi:hypothetical protein
MVHRLGDLRNSGEAFHGEVKSPLHHSENRRELSELISFRRDQWMFFEERYDLMPKVFEPEDPINEEIFAVIVMAFGSDTSCHTRSSRG